MAWHGDVWLPLQGDRTKSTSVGRYPVQYMWHVPAINRAQNTNMFSRVGKVNAQAINGDRAAELQELSLLFLGRR